MSCVPAACEQSSFDPRFGEIAAGHQYGKPALAQLRSLLGACCFGLAPLRQGPPGGLIHHADHAPVRARFKG
jgi:hypothetical protein